MCTAYSIASRRGPIELESLGNEQATSIQKRSTRLMPKCVVAPGLPASRRSPPRAVGKDSTGGNTQTMEANSNAGHAARENILATREAKVFVFRALQSEDQNSYELIVFARFPRSEQVLPMCLKSHGRPQRVSNANGAENSGKVGHLGILLLISTRLRVEGGNKCTPTKQTL